jgi:hypothetical protein
MLINLWNGPGVDHRNREQVDEAVFDRFQVRLSYMSGDFGDAATYQGPTTYTWVAGCRGWPWES